MAKMAIKDPLIGKEIKDYRFAEKLGGGAFGAVYKAEHIRLQKDFAIKVLHPHIAGDEGIVERFRREARSLATLNHPNIVQIVDFDFSEDIGFYLILEWIKGKPLSRLLKEEGFLPLPLVMDLFSQLLSALEEAHNAGIVHRDLKPANLMVTPTGAHHVLKILDFGIASLEDDDKGLTMTGTAMGSANYMSPEQALGNVREIDPRSDIYSCGIVLGKSLTGRNVFLAESPTQILWKHIYEEPPTLRAMRPDGNFSPSLEAIFAKALAKKKDERFSSANEFLKALQDAVDGGALSYSKTTTPVQPKARRIPTVGEASSSGISSASGSQSGQRNVGFASAIRGSEHGELHSNSSGAMRPVQIRDEEVHHGDSSASFSASGSGSGLSRSGSSISSPFSRSGSTSGVGNRTQLVRPVGTRRGANRTALREPETQQGSWKIFVLVGVVGLLLLGGIGFWMTRSKRPIDTNLTTTKEDDWDSVMKEVGDVRRRPPPRARSPKRREAGAIPAVVPPPRRERKKLARRTPPRIRRVRKFSLLVKSSPSGARVYMNGRRTSRKTPATFDLPAGKSVRFKLVKCKYLTKSFQWTAFSDTSKTLRLPPDLFGTTHCKE